MTIKWGDLCKFNICVSIIITFFFANYKMITMGAYQNRACIIEVHEFETLLTFKMQLQSSLKVLYQNVVFLAFPYNDRKRCKQIYLLSHKSIKF